jgi:hypothetical protein
MTGEDRFGEDVAASYDEDTAGMSKPSSLGPELDVLEERRPKADATSRSR